MDLPYTLALILGAIALAVAIRETLLSSRSLRRYWSRDCTGRAWRDQFPSAAKEDIRRFLLHFVDALLFSPRHALRFEPTDRVLAVYRALYPLEGWPDNLELERLASILESSYGLALRDVWNEELTLGDLFSRTRRGAA